ncbi:undecaprenyl-diphosphate phosphatase [Candidatus Pelagibacter sp.]|nr:undecaprenyl-diphosphate phosphatase [Candidatus Pelagibacter sp.]
MLFDYYEILILSLIQGVSEFIPVSSSAHLYIISELFDFKNQSLMIDVGMHLGSLLAVLFYFRQDFLNILKNKQIFNLMVIGSIPLIIAGFIIYTTGLIDFARNLKLLAWLSLIFAIVLYFADKVKVTKKIDTNLNLKTILIIGLFQIASLFPGVSRSGIVITAGRFLNFDRYDAAKISFYLSVPAIAGASFLSLKDVFTNDATFNSLIILSVFLSFIFSYITIKYFLIFIKNFNFNLFVIYRIILSLFIFYIIYS